MQTSTAHVLQGTPVWTRLGERVGRVHGARQRVAPAQIGAHGGQQQAVGKPRDAQRHRRSERQRKRQPQQ